MFKEEKQMLILGFEKRMISITLDDYEFISGMKKINYENKFFIDFIPNYQALGSYIELRDYFDNSLLGIIHFEEGTLEGKKCFHIVEVVLDPRQESELGHEPEYYYNYLITVFSLIDELIRMRHRHNKFYQTKFYIRNLENKTYDVVVGLKQPIPIFEFLMKNKIDFGIKVM